MPASPTLWRNAFFASTTALIATGALWIALPAPAAAPVPSPPSPPPEPVPVSIPSPAPPPLPPGDTCCSALDKCRAENWSTLVRTLGLDAVRPLDAGVQAAAAATDAGSGTGAEAQQQALDEMARALLRQQLVQAQGLIYALMHDMGTEAWGKQWTIDEINRIDPELHLDDMSRRRLSEGFESLWAARGPAFQRALQDNPPNGRAFHEAVKDFFRGQDELVEHVLGAEAREKYRAIELGSRSAVAAISATLADAPWDHDSIGW